MNVEKTSGEHKNEREQELEKGIQKELKEFFKERPSIAFLEVLPKEGVRTADLASSDLKQKVKNQLLKECVDPLQSKMSVSHTTWGRCGLVLVIGSDQFVGVDVENCERPVHSALGPRISPSDESRYGLSPLEIWVIKEAAFKANPYNQGTYLPQYQLIGWNKASQKGRIQLPQLSSWECSFKLLKIQDWVIVLAVASIISGPRSGVLDKVLRRE